MLLSSVLCSNDISMSESFVSTVFNFGVWKTYVESSDILIFDETSESSDSPVLLVINCKLFLT